MVLEATDSNVDLVLSANRVVGNATTGVQFDFTASNLGGRISGKTVENNAGDGMVFNAASTLYRLYAQTKAKNSKKVRIITLTFTTKYNYN